MHKKLFHTNLPQAGFELGSLEPQPGVLPIEPLKLVESHFWVSGIKIPTVI